MLHFERDSKLILENTEEYSKAVAVANLRVQNTIQENEIDSKFLELHPHPSTRDLCGFAHLVYKKEKKDLLQDDYVLIIEGSSKATGYEGALFYRRKSSKHHHQLIIAHRGTDSDAGDWQADYDGVVNNRLTPQINSACTFALECVSKLCPPQEHPDQAGLAGHILCLPAQISITGHSLGGWLAQISAFAVKYLTLNGVQFQLAPHRGNKFHPHVQVFDSPGAFQIISKITSLKPFRALKLQTVNFGLDISNFVLSPNGVNVVNEHVGDMFLLQQEAGDNSIPYSDHDKPTKFFSKKNLTYTKNTHSIKCFVQNLLSNPHPRQYRVEDDWILIIFGNWDTKKSRKINKHLNIFSLVGSGFKQLLSNGWSDTTSEYETFFQSGLSVTTSSAGGHEVLRINALSLSKDQLKVIESCKTVNVWRRYFARSGSELPLKLGILQPILDFISKCKDRDELEIPNQRDFNILQNCGLILPLIEKWCDALLENFEMAKTRCNSEKYIHEMMNTFISLDFECINTNWKEEYRNSSPSLLKVFCFQICSWIIQGKCGLSGRNSLILRYGDVPDWDNLSWIPDGIQFIFLDCTLYTNHDMMGKYEQSVYSSSEEEYRFIPIILDPAAKGKVDLNISRSCYGAILKQRVNLQGVSLELGELVGTKTELVMSTLLRDHQKLALLLQKQGTGGEGSNLLEIGIVPPSIFDNINMYVEPCREFSSVEEAVQEMLFKFEGIGAGNHGKLLIYELEGNSDLEGLLKNCILNDTDLTNSVTILHVQAEEAVTYFQQFCKENPSFVVALVEFRKSDSIFWKLHYNPDLYQKRTVTRPAVDIGPLVHHPAITWNDALEIQSEQGSRLQLLSLNCANIEDKCFLRNNLKILAPSVVIQENQLKSIDFKPGADGSCEIILYDLKEDSKTVVRFEAKPEISEILLNRKEEEGTTTSRNRSLLCISDRPGMGKSFSMITLANNVLRNNMSKDWNWVFFIPLKELQNFNVIMEEGITKVKSDNEVEIMLENIVSFFSSNCKHLFKHLDQFSCVLFRNMMRSRVHSSKLYFVLDGFDELGVKDKRIMSKVLNFLTLYSSINIAVSTRTRDNLLVERALGVLSHHLLPLDEHDTFLFNIWRGIIPKALTTCNQERLKGFCSALMKKVDESFSLTSVENEQFLGIPLHLKLLSVAFLQSAQEYCSVPRVNDLLEEYIPLKYSLGFLLDRFVQRKYELFFNKMGLKDGSLLNEMKASLTPEFEREMEFLACNVLQLGDDNFNELMWETYTVRREGLSQKVSTHPSFRDIYRIGIVHLVDGRPEFLHRSIAEYYVANVIFHCFKQICSPKLADPFNNRENLSLNHKLFKVCRVAIFENDRRLVRSFLNQRMCADVEIMEKIKRQGDSLPRLTSSGGVDDAILNCFYEMVRIEYNSTALLRFVLSTFINWELTSRHVFLIMCLSSLSVFPLTGNTLETVAILVHSHILQIREGSSQSLVELVKIAPDLSEEFQCLKFIVTDKPDSISWWVFRRDFKPVLEKEWSTLGFEEITKEILLSNNEMREKLQREYKIEHWEFDVIVKFLFWVYEFIQKLGKDVKRQ